MKKNKIEIYINGEKVIVSKNINLKKLLENLSIKNELIAVEINKEVVPKSEYKKIEINNKDKIEILELIGGG